MAFKSHKTIWYVHNKSSPGVVLLSRARQGCITAGHQEYLRERDHHFGCTFQKTKYAMAQVDPQGGIQPPTLMTEVSCSTHLSC